MSRTPLPRLDAWKLALREEDRIKHGVDYAVAVKYGEVHVYCATVYAERIRELAAEYDVCLTSVATWGRG